MPAYFKEDGSITVIANDYGEIRGINDNNEMVGVPAQNRCIIK